MNPSTIAGSLLIAAVIRNSALERSATTSEVPSSAMKHFLSFCASSECMATFISDGFVAEILPVLAPVTRNEQ